MPEASKLVAGGRGAQRRPPPDYDADAIAPRRGCQRVGLEDEPLRSRSSRANFLFSRFPAGVVAALLDRRLQAGILGMKMPMFPSG